MKYRTRLRALLKANGMTRRDILRQTTMTYPTLLLWETETLDSLNPRHLQAILRIVRCTYDELVYPVVEAAPDEALVIAEAV
jgi:transcriptional regulator with XRE-family HTH domain